MITKQSQSPYGYRNLLVYKKAEELQANCAALTHTFPKTKTLVALADQMDRSARSTKQNVVEGWKRNSTKEYYEFLGFAIASNAELEEDCTDIWKGMYPELMGVRGVVGERGVMGVRGTPSSLSSPSSSSHLDIEKIPFYPLEPSLPPVVQLKLRAKEVNFLMSRLQKSLLAKMVAEKTLSAADKLKRAEGEKGAEEKLYEGALAEHGLVRLENGRVVKISEMGETGRGKGKKA